jgi:hypothetical protein
LTAPAAAPCDALAVASKPVSDLVGSELDELEVASSLVSFSPLGKSVESEAKDEETGEELGESKPAVEEGVEWVVVVS